MESKHQWLKITPLFSISPEVMGGTLVLLG